MEQYDGIWRAERTVSGSWIATRYLEDPALNQSKRREQDFISRNGITVANYLDTLGQCEERCAVLNKSP